MIGVQTLTVTVSAADTEAIMEIPRTPPLVGSTPNAGEAVACIPVVAPVTVTLPDAQAPAVSAPPPIEPVVPVNADCNLPEVGSVTFVGPVLVNVMEFAPAVASVDPSAMVKVAEVAGAVMATLFRVVALAAPRIGEASVGFVPNTKTPVPVAPALVTPSIVGCPGIVGPSGMDSVQVPVVVMMQVPVADIWLAVPAIVKLVTDGGDPPPFTVWACAG